MKVLIMHAGQPAQDYYRVSEPIRAIEEASLGIEILTSRGLATTVVKNADGSDEVVDVDPQGADVVVLQLPKTEQMLQCIRLLQSMGVAVVVEMDDLLSAVPFGHSGHEALIRKGMARWGLACAREADLVTATTPALLDEYAPNGGGVVIPNAVPRRVAELPPAYDRDPAVVTVGWSGNVFGHPYDLQEMGSGLQQALDRTAGRSRFLVLGQKWDAKQRMRLTDEPDEIGWIYDLDGYVRTVGEQFDIGIAPLRIDKFNTCKSWLKAVEYSARGVPFVRAASPEYDRLGMGRRAKSPKDWAKALTSLIDDRDAARDMAVRNREVVLERHLTEHTAPMWVQAWERALDTRERAQRRGA